MKWDQISECKTATGSCSVRSFSEKAVYPLNGLNPARGVLRSVKFGIVLIRRPTHFEHRSLSETSGTGISFDTVSTLTSAMCPHPLR